ncbi:MAG: hypothetical protein ABR501_09990, partial [Pyrinomonadaceae bacterium]
MKNTIVSLCLFGMLATAGSVCAQSLSEMPPPPPPQAPVLRKIATPSVTTSAERPTPDKEADPEVDENDIVRVNTSLITVPAEVLDRNGRYISNLRKEDFRIYENGIEQELAYFASVDQPFTVALLLDVSGSTQS